MIAMHKLVKYAMIAEDLNVNSCVCIPSRNVVRVIKNWKTAIVTQAFATIWKLKWQLKALKSAHARHAKLSFFVSLASAITPSHPLSLLCLVFPEVKNIYLPRCYLNDLTCKVHVHYKQPAI